MQSQNVLTITLITANDPKAFRPLIHLEQTLVTPGPEALTPPEPILSTRVTFNELIEFLAQEVADMSKTD